MFSEGETTNCKVSWIQQIRFLVVFVFNLGVIKPPRAILGHRYHSEIAKNNNLCPDYNHKMALQFENASSVVYTVDQLPWEKIEVSIKASIPFRFGQLTWILDADFLFENKHVNRKKTHLVESKLNAKDQTEAVWPFKTKALVTLVKSPLLEKLTAHTFTSGVQPHEAKNL